MGKTSGKTKKDSRSIAKRTEYSGFTAAVLFMGLFVAVGLTALVLGRADHTITGELPKSADYSSEQTASDSQADLFRVSFCDTQANLFEYTILTAERKNLSKSCEQADDTTSYNSQPISPEAKAAFRQRLAKNDAYDVNKSKVIAQSSEGSHLVGRVVSTNDAPSQIMIYNLNDNTLRPITDKDIVLNSVKFLGENTN